MNLVCNQCSMVKNSDFKKYKKFANLEVFLYPRRSSRFTNQSSVQLNMPSQNYIRNRLPILKQYISSVVG